MLTERNHGLAEITDTRPPRPASPTAQCHAPQYRRISSAHARLRRSPRSAHDGGRELEIGMAHLDRMRRSRRDSTRPWTPARGPRSPATSPTPVPRRGVRRQHGPRRCRGRPSTARTRPLQTGRHTRHPLYLSADADRAGDLVVDGQHDPVVQVNDLLGLVLELLVTSPPVRDKLPHRRVSLSRTGGEVTTSSRTSPRRSSASEAGSCCPVGQQIARPVGISGKVERTDAYVFLFQAGTCVQWTAYPDIEEGRAAAERLGRGTRVGDVGGERGRG